VEYCAAQETLKVIKETKDIIHEGKLETKDITELLHKLEGYSKELIEAKEEYEGLFYEAPLPYIVIDQTFAITKYNQAANNVFGFESSLEEHSLLKYLAQDSIQAFREWIETHSYLQEALVVDILLDKLQKLKFQIQLAKSPSNHNQLILSLSNIQTHYDLIELCTQQQKSISFYSHYQEILLSLFDKGDAVLCKWKNDKEWSIDYLSKSIKELTGYYSKELIEPNIPYTALIHPDDIARVKTEVSDAIRYNLNFFQHAPYRLVTKEGRACWVLDRTIADRDDQGNIIHFIGYIVNIDETKRLNIALQTERDRYRSLLSLSSDAILILKVEDGKLVEYSEYAKKLLGYSDQEMQSLSVYDWDDNLTPDEFKRMVENIENTPYHTERYFISKDGSYHLASISVVKVQFDDEELLYTAARDITEEKKLFHTLQEEQRLTSAMINTANAIIAVIEPNGTMKHVNRYAEEFTGYTQEVIASRPYFWTRFIPKTALNDVLMIIHRAKKGEIVKSVQNGWISKEGEERIFEWSNTLVNKSDGSLEYLFTIGIDITDKIKLQTKIKEREYRWKLAIESSGDGLWDWNIDDNSVYFSPQWKTMIGYEDHELENRFGEWESRIHPDDTQQVYQDLLKHLEGENDFYINEHRLKCKDGSYKWILTKGIIVLRDPQGKPLRLIGTHSDIDARKRSQEEIKKAEMKFHTLFEESLDGIALLDTTNLHFIEVNRKLEKMYGYTKEEFKQISPRELEVLEDPKAIEARRKKMLREGYDRFTTKHYTKSGAIIDVLLNVALIVLEGEQLLYISFHDMSSEVQLQQSLLEAKEEAERANQAKSQFLANMSHEIRTPLNGVIGLTDIVLKSNLDPLQREYLTRAQNSSNALLDIINDILDYSKIEAGKLNINKEPFELNQLLQKSANIFGFKAYQKDIEFVFNIDPMIPNELIGDEFRINQILSNIIGNAIKFTHQGFVRLKLKILDQAADTMSIEFSVEDSGVGINPKDYQKLFSPFEQADLSTTKQFGGTGLGLMISKQLVELMGGKLWFESSKGKGSTFNFTLSLEIPHPKEEMEYHLLAQKPILILSTNANDYSYLSNVLTLWGANVTVASSFQDAKKQLHNGSYSHLLIGWQFAQSNPTIFKELKNLTNTTYILFTSIYHKQGIVESAQKEQVSFHATLEKPYTPYTIYALLTQKEQTNPIDANAVKNNLTLESPKKLLLVEDNDTNRLVASLMLKTYGFEIDVARNGQEAVNKIQESFYDVIFMDIQMPIMDGFKATQRIREFDQSVPIIALSAAVMQEDIEKAYRVGMDAHLAKPIQEHKLEETLQKFFSFKSEKMLPKEEYQPAQASLIEGIDMMHVKDKLHLDESALYKIYENFYNNYRLSLNILNPQESDQAKLQAYIHKLKGVSGNLEMHTIYQRCVAIEQKGITPSDLKSLKELLIDTLDQIQSKILPKVEPKLAQQKSKSKDEIVELLNQILFKLQNAYYLSRENVLELYEDLEGYIDPSSHKAILKLFDALEEEQLEELLSKIQMELGKK